jgi:Tfp pilus assembly protein PilO
MTGGNGKPGNPLLSDVTPISGLIEIAGNYRQVLSFARQLESADRLLNLSSVGWIRSDNGSDVHMSATITRYVVPAPTSAASAPAPTNS